MFQVVENQEREDAQAVVKVASKKKAGTSSSRSRKASSKNTIDKALKKQAKSNVLSTMKEEKSSKDDWGFSDDSENQEMLSLSERLNLKKFEDDSDASSISSISSNSKASKASSSSKQVSSSSYAEICFISK